MKVLRADTGETYLVDAAPSATIQSVKTLLQQVSLLEPAQQILLCDGANLDAARRLQDYSLPTGDDSRPVFLFPRSALDPSAPLPGPVVLLPQDLDLPAAPAPGADHRALFAHHLALGEALFNGARARLAVCRRCLAEQYTQAKGLQAAVSNLNVYHRRATQEFSRFDADLTKTLMRHEGLLASFENDVARLGQVELHPRLQTAARKTLRDVVPLDNLRKWAAECQREYKQFSTRVVDLRRLVTAVADGVETENRDGPQINFSQLEAELAKGRDLEAQQGTYCQVVQHDHERARKLLDAGETASGDMAALLDDMLQRQTGEHFPAMRDVDAQLRAVMDVFATAKTNLTLAVVQRLRAISKLQMKLHLLLAEKLPLYVEGLKKQQKNFHELVILQHMPRAYAAALAETVRRREAGQTMMTLGIHLTELLARVRDDELARREVFSRRYGSATRNLVPGLTSSLPVFELKLTPNGGIDPKLLDLDRSELDAEGVAAVRNDSGNDPGDVVLDRFRALLRDAFGVNASSLQFAGGMRSPSTPEGMSRNSSYERGLRLLGETASGSLRSSSQTEAAEASRLARELAAEREARLMHAERTKTLEARIAELEQQQQQQQPPQQHGHRPRASSSASGDPQAQLEAENARLRQEIKLLRGGKSSLLSSSEDEVSAELVQAAAAAIQQASVSDLDTADLRKRISELEAEVKSRTDELDAARSAHAKELDAATAAAQATADQLAGLQQSKADAAERVAAIEAQLAGRAKDMAALEERVAAQSKEAESLQAQLEAKAKDVAKLETQAQTAVQNDAEAQSTRIEMLLRQLDDAGKAEEELTDKVSVLEARLASMAPVEEQLRACHSRVRQLEQADSQSAETVSDLTRRLDETNATVDLLKKELSKEQETGRQESRLRAEITVLKQQLSEATLNNAQLERSLNQQRVEADVVMARAIDQVSQHKSTLLRIAELLHGCGYPNAVLSGSAMSTASNATDEADVDLAAVQSQIEDITKQLAQLRAGLASAEHLVDDLAFEKNAMGRNKVTIGRFQKGDLTLFLRDRNRGSDDSPCYVAFTGNPSAAAPHFLSQDVITALKREGTDLPDHVLGHIVIIEEHTAAPAFNPHKLDEGVPFCIATIELAAL